MAVLAPAAGLGFATGALTGDAGRTPQAAPSAAAPTYDLSTPSSGPTQQPGSGGTGDVDAGRTLPDHDGARRDPGRTPGPTPEATRTPTQRPDRGGGTRSPDPGGGGDPEPTSPSPTSSSPPPTPTATTQRGGGGNDLVG